MHGGSGKPKDPPPSIALAGIADFNPFPHKELVLNHLQNAIAPFGHNRVGHWMPPCLRALEDTEPVADG